MIVSRFREGSARSWAQPERGAAARRAGCSDHGGGQPGGVDLEVNIWEVAEAGVLAGAEVLDAGVDAVGGVDVGVLPAPVPGAGGP